MGAVKHFLHLGSSLGTLIELDPTSRMLEARKNGIGKFEYEYAAQVNEGRGSND
jgi:hypothetical protein